MELRKENLVSINGEDPYFHRPHLPALDILSIAKPPAKGVDGDWERVFYLLKNAGHEHQFFTACEGAEDGRTILHYACIRKNRQAAIETVQKIFECTQHSNMEDVDQIEFVNKIDINGDTALQLATKKWNKALVKLLIENGADINLLKNDTKEIHLIYDEVLIGIFDESIHIEKDDELANKPVWKVDCNFGPITGLYSSNSSYKSNPKKPLNQTRHLATMLRRETATRTTIIEHPLVQIFLHIKHEKFAIFLYISMFCHMLWCGLNLAAIFCNTHILNSSANINNSIASSNLSICQPFRIYEIGTYEFRHNAYFYIMILLHLYCIAREFVEMYTCPDKGHYWKQMENYSQWIVIIAFVTVGITSIFTTKLDLNFHPGDDESFKGYVFWKLYIPATYIAGMFTSLLLIQSQLRKFKILGIYNEMFIKGFRNVMKFLLAFLPFLTAFLIIFHILLPMNDEFNPAFGLGFTRILAMLTGEVDYVGTVYGDNEEEIAFKNVLKFMLLVVVITVVILLQNLLIGMTVSDVQKIEKKAKVNQLARRLEDINLMEDFIVNPWLVKVMLYFKLDDKFKRAVIVDKTDTQKVKDGIVKRNKRLAEYSHELRETIIQWDKNRQIED